MPSRAHTITAVLAGMLIGSGLTLVRGVLADREAEPPPIQPLVVRSEGRLLDEIEERIRLDYVDPVELGRLERAAVDGLVASLDPHSAFLDASAYDEMRINTAGNYTGVGIEISVDDGQVTVVSPIAGSPAARAGLLAGDVIVAVDGRDLSTDPLESAIARLRGLTGSQVRLSVRRAGSDEPLEFELQRSRVHVPTVRFATLPGGYGYLSIAQFTESTPADFDEALLGLDTEIASPLLGLVLDLRGNPGGVLESSVIVADKFLDQGIIVRADGRAPDARFEMNATPGDVLDGAPLVVLVNGGSASGAEIVAGALRDHGRATLIGQRTFGKGSVQTVIPLREGQALKLTTSRYYTPSGASIHESGLEPDVVVADQRQAAGTAPSTVEPRDDATVRAALQYLRDRSLGPKLALRDRQ